MQPVAVLAGLVCSRMLDAHCFRASWHCYCCSLSLIPRVALPLAIRNELYGRLPTAMNLRGGEILLVSREDQPK